MNLIKTVLLTSAFALSFSVYAQTQPTTAPNTAVTADKTSVDNACKAEAATAGCGSDQVGTGLLKCIRAYKKANKGFKLSPACKSAVQTLRSARKAAKGQ